MRSEVLETIAVDLLAAAGYGSDEPVDALGLAACCGLEVVTTNVRDALTLGGTIYVPSRIRPARVHGLVAHELGHFALGWADERDSEDEANFLSGAILVPRRMLERELLAGWDLERLMRSHTNASAELLARRVADVRRASIAVYDAGHLRYRAGTATPPAMERALVEEALASERPVRVNDLCGAWPVIDGDRRRVIVLAG